MLSSSGHLWEYSFEMERYLEDSNGPASSSSTSNVNCQSLPPVLIHFTHFRCFIQQLDTRISGELELGVGFFLEDLIFLMTVDASFVKTNVALIFGARVVFLIIYEHICVCYFL